MGEIDIKRLKVDADYWDECGAPEDASDYALLLGGGTWLKCDEEGCPQLWHMRFSEWRSWVGDARPEKIIPRPTNHLEPKP